jgi:hypothetical protein
MDITDRYKVCDLTIYLSNLEEIISKRIELGKIEFWIHLFWRDFIPSVNEQNIIERILKKKRNLLLYCGFNSDADSESSEPVALLRDLRSQLSSQEYQQHSLSIDRIESGFKAQAGIRESNMIFMIYLQNEIESELSEYQRLLSEQINNSNNTDRIDYWNENDHWLAPKR